MGSIEESPQDAPSASVPIVDFSKWYGASPDAKKEVAAELINACKNLGFVCIINHGVPQNRLDDAFAMAKALFDLPMEDKMKAPHPDGPDVHRGYSYPGLEKVSQFLGNDTAVAERLRTVFDMKESYEVGSEQNSLQPNVWLPESTLPNFKKFTTDFYWECNIVAREILKCISLGLGLDENYLLQFHTGEYNQLRLLHYPPVPAHEIENGSKVRIPGHTDWGSITLLFQDDCGGLELEDPHHPGIFVPATPVSGSCFMNIGDMLMRWSNDTLKSTLHRVTLPPLTSRYTGPNRMTRARYSIPYFCSANPDTVIECLPTCVDEKNPAKYGPITQEDWSRVRRGIQYKSSKPADETVKKRVDEMGFTGLKEQDVPVAVGVA